MTAIAPTGPDGGPAGELDAAVKAPVAGTAVDRSRSCAARAVLAAMRP